MHHKKGRPRNRRAGCKYCKRHKVNGVRTESKGGEQFSAHRARYHADKDIEEFKSRR